MDAALGGGRGPERQGDVEALGFEPGGERGGGEGRALLLDGAGDPGLEAVDQRAGALALVGRHGAERRQEGRDRALLAQGGDADRLERSRVGGRGDGGGKLGAQARNVIGEAHVQFQFRRANKKPCAKARTGGARLNVRPRKRLARWLYQATRAAVVFSISPR